MSKLEAIIALENQVEANITKAKAEKEAMLEKTRLEVNKTIDALRKEQQAKIQSLHEKANQAVLDIKKQNEIEKQKLHKKIETEYKGVTKKYLELLKKEVLSK